jgi:hypothetical protein
MRFSWSAIFFVLSLLALFPGPQAVAQTWESIVDQTVAQLERRASAQGARSSSQDTHSFCESPFEAVCGGEAPAPIAAPVEQPWQAPAITEFKRRVLLLAGRRFLAQQPGPAPSTPPTDTEILALVETWTGLSATTDTAKAFGRVKVQVHQELLAPILEAERRRTPMIQALFEATLPSSLHFSRLNSIRFLTQEEVQALFNGNPNLQYLLQDLHVRNCSPDGLDLNAYALPGYREGMSPFLVLCPGLAIQSASGSGLASLQAIAHELSHSIDSRYFPSEFETFEHCLAENHAEELKLALPPEARSSAIALTLAHQQMPEISADLRALGAIRQVLTAMDSNMEQNPAHRWNASKRQRVKLQGLREMFAPYCRDEATDGSHPSGKLRIEALLGGDRQIRQRMGCTTPQALPTSRTRCSL